MWLQDITIYHKEGTAINRYNLKASVRNTSYLNRNQTGVSSTDSAIIRVFDTKGYNNTWKCEKGDVVVAKRVTDDVEKAPFTEMLKKYGKSYVYEVSSIDIYDFNGEVSSLDEHIKIGGR